MRRFRRSLIAPALGALLLLPACPSADAGDGDVEITDTGAPTDGTTTPSGTDSPEDEGDPGGEYGY